MQVKEHDILETLQLLADRLTLPRPEVLAQPTFVPAGHPLLPVERAIRSGAHCQACGTFVHMALVTPCAHVLCAGCMSKDSTRCMAKCCGRPFTMQGVDDAERCALAAASLLLSGLLAADAPAKVQPSCEQF